MSRYTVEIKKWRQTKNVVDGHECTVRKSTSSSYFVIYFGFLFDGYYSESPGKTVYGESVEIISFFMAYFFLKGEEKWIIQYD